MRALIKTEASYVRCLQREIKLPNRIQKRVSSQTALKETSQSGDSIRSEIDIEKSRRRTVLRLAHPLAGIERVHQRSASGKDFSMPATSVRICDTYMHKSIGRVHVVAKLQCGTQCTVIPVALNYRKKHLNSTIDARERISFC